MRGASPSSNSGIQDGVTGGWSKERRELKERKGVGGARVINTICCVTWNKTPCREIRRRKGGWGGWQKLSQLQPEHPWPLDDTSHRQSDTSLIFLQSVGACLQAFKSISNSCFARGGQFMIEDAFWNSVTPVRPQCIKASTDATVNWTALENRYSNASLLDGPSQLILAPAVYKQPKYAAAMMRKLPEFSSNPHRLNQTKCGTVNPHSNFTAQCVCVSGCATSLDRKGYIK